MILLSVYSLASERVVSIIIGAKHSSSHVYFSLSPLLTFLDIKPSFYFSFILPLKIFNTNISKLYVPSMFHIVYLIIITFSHFCVKSQYLTHMYLSFANVSKIFLPLTHSTYFFSLFFSGMEGRPRKHGRIPTQDTFRKGPFICRSMVSFLRMKSAHHISDLVMG